MFPGASGAGKSTTTAAFHSQGFRVLTDDVGAVRLVSGGRCLLCPGGSRLRLPDDTRATLGGTWPNGVFQWDKHTFDLSDGEPLDALPVRSIWSLEQGTEIGTGLIAPLPAVALLSRHSFVVHRRMDKEALADHMRDCALVAGSVPVYRLVRPRSLLLYRNWFAGLSRR